MKFEILKPQSFCVGGKDKVLEDNIFPEAGSGTVHDRLFLVADGMGGQGKGDVASASLCRSIPEFLFQNTCSDEPLTADLLHLTLLNAYKQLAQDCTNGGGVMFAMVYFHRQGVMAAHVGNCRIYQFRPKTRTLLYKSRDDFKAATPDMVQPVEPAHKNLTNVKYGDYFLMLTKGAHACINEEQLFGVLCEAINDEAKLRKIRQLIGDNKEDCTVSLVRVSGVMVEAIDEHVKDEAEPIPVAVAPAPKPAPKPQPKPAPKPQPKPQPQAEKVVPKEQLAQEHRAEEGTSESVNTEEKKSGFPVVPITALLLVGLAIGFYLWSRSQISPKEEEEVEAPVVVRKDSVKKDTINIMRNESAKSKANDDLFKLPEEQKADEKKKTEAEQKRPETDPVPDVTNENADENVPSATDPSAATTPAAPSATPPATPPATTTQPAAGPPADNPAPSTVEPRPVIPDD